MGDYNRYQPSERQLEGAKFLISYGVSRFFIAPDYKLVAHNQTQVTRSPGSFLYREIIKWQRWFPCNVKNVNLTCGPELKSGFVSSLTRNS